MSFQFYEIIIRKYLIVLSMFLVFILIFETSLWLHWKYKITFLFESMTHKILVRQTTSFFLHWIIMQVTRNTFCNFYSIFLTGNLNCLFPVLPFWIYNKVFKFFHYCTEMLKLQHFLWKHNRLLVRNKKIALILKNPTKLIEAYVLRKKKK